MVTFMWRTGKIMGDTSQGELAARCLFCVFIYCASAIQLERLRKEAFIGREASQKNFHRWLKIFDTFPEGLMLVRGSDVVYANHSISKLLEIKNYSLDGDPFFETLRKSLRETKVQKLD